MKIRPLIDAIAKASRGRRSGCSPAARLQPFVPRINGMRPGFKDVETGTSQAKMRERKFVISLAANHVAFGASAATTTSALFPSRTTFAHSNGHNAQDSAATAILFITPLFFNAFYSDIVEADLPRSTLSYKQIIEMGSADLAEIDYVP